MSNREPTINLIKPNLTYWGKLTTETTTEIGVDLAKEISDFFDATLIPDLVCAPTGPDRPHPSWIAAEGRKLVTCRSEAGKLIGCWILKDHGIFYACVDVTHGAEGCLPILRALAYKSFEEEGNELWASTQNPLIKQWATKAIMTPEEGRPANMPLPSFNGDRVEWK